MPRNQSGVLFAFLLFILAMSACKQKASVLASQYGGFYTMGDTLKEKAYGEVSVYPENDSTALFYLYVNKGEPSYNSGEVAGRITIRDGKAVFRKRLAYAESDCVLNFLFDGDNLTVTEGEGDCDCSFGHGVGVNHTFTRANAEIPQCYTTLGNGTIYFKDWTDEEGAPQEQAEGALPSIDKTFIDCFADLKLGSAHKGGKLIPKEILRKYISDVLAEEEEGELDGVYATGKIMNYRGMNLFIFDHSYERPDEETYDNHTDGNIWILFFHQDGSPVIDSEREGDEGSNYRMIHYLNSHYYGEGGERSRESYFDKDTTIVTKVCDSQSESATGFDTPFISTVEYRWKITANGNEELMSVAKCEYSSPFYNLNFLKQQSWDKVEDEGHNRTYPTTEARWEMTFSNEWSAFNENSQKSIIDVYFHIERRDGVLTPIFETSIRMADNSPGRIIDSYIVGEPRIIEPEKSNVTWNKTVKCPIIIKTSDGDLELLPNGKLRLL